MGYARSLLVRARSWASSAEAADLDLALQMLVGSVFARRVAGHSQQHRVGRAGRRRHLGRHGRSPVAGPPVTSSGQGRMPRT